MADITSQCIVEDKTNMFAPFKPDWLEDFYAFAQDELHYKLEPFHKDMCEGLGYRYLAVKCPRGHGKTTLFSIAYPLYKMYKVPDFKVCGVSSALDQSWKTMDIIMQKIEESNVLNNMLEEGRQKHWSRFGVSLTNNSRYFVKPFNSTIRGTHVNLFICDDIERDEKITQEQIKVMFWQTIFPCVQTLKGQLIDVGTPMTLDDLLAELEEVSKKDPTWCFKKYSAVITDDKENWIKPMWDSNFTLAELERLRDNMGRLMFSREYLCNPLAGGSSLFPEALLLRQTKNAYQERARGGCNYYMGVDVALTEGPKADWTVFTILEKDNKDNYHVVKIDRFQTDDQDSMIKKMKDLNKHFQFRKILIEDKGLSKGLVKMATSDMHLKYIAEGFITTKESKMGIISHIEGAMTAGKLFIPDNSQLQKELSAFGIRKDKFGRETLEGLGAHDDMVISLALAYEATLEPKGSYSVKIM